MWTRDPAARFVLCLLTLITACRDATTAEVGDSVIHGDCAECVRLKVSLAARLGGPSADVGGFSAIPQDSRGRMFLHHDFSGPKIDVFTPAGSHYASFGRQGSGPGEFRRPRLVAVVSDSIFVFDAVARRVSVFDSALAFTRQFGVAGLQPWRLLLFPTGPILFSGYRAGQESAGAPFHVMDRAGGWLRSFPVASEPYRMEQEVLLRRPITRASDSTFWAPRPLSYALELWTLGGQLLRTIHREVDWFPSHAEQTRFRPGVEPTPIVKDVWFDGRQRLWVLSHVADKRWRDQFPPGRPAEFAFNGNLGEYFDSVLEVIDTKRNVVVAHKRFDPFVACITQHGQLGVYRELDGNPIIDVWSVTGLDR